MLSSARQHDSEFGRWRRTGGKLAAAERRDQTVNCRQPALVKIRPDFGVFLVADSVHLFQIIGASKWSRGDDSRSHNWSNTRNHFQFLYRRGVDVDSTWLDFFFCMRVFKVGRTDS